MERGIRALIYMVQVYTPYVLFYCSFFFFCILIAVIVVVSSWPSSSKLYVYLLPNQVQKQMIEEQ